jgi:putative methyltransferase (TIGR04325 family)
MRLNNIIPRIFRHESPTSSPCPLDEYQTFNSAMKDSDTYEDPGVIEVVALKTQAHRKSLSARAAQAVSSRQTVQNMFVVSYAAANSRPIHVLELGGACGASYFELNHLLPGMIGSWGIVETRGMAAAGRKLFENHTIKFFDNLSAAMADRGNPDLVIAQGVLQYCQDPLETLDNLLKLEFTYLYITRTAVSSESPTVGTIITKQVTNLSDHGPGVFPSGLTDRKSSQALTIIPYESVSSRIAAACRPLVWFDEGDGTQLIGSRTVTTRTMGVLANK